MKNKLKLVFVFTLQLILASMAFLPVSAAGTGEIYYSLYEAKGAVVQGIVEENNTALGYITLYNEDGSGTDWYVEGVALRTFYYNLSSDLSVYKNHKKSGMSDIEAGNSVFLKLDENGKVISVSAMDNFIVRYGCIVSKNTHSILVEFDNYEQMLLDIDNDVKVLSDGNLTEYSELSDGDQVKLTLHITNYFTKLKYIAIEGSAQNITAIYKGTMTSINSLQDKIILRNLQELVRGQWITTEQKLFTALTISDECEIFAEDINIDVRWANRYFKGKEVYIAASNNYSGKKEAEVITFRDNYNTEINYEDTIGFLSNRADTFTLFNSNREVKLMLGSIILKDNKLVKKSSITREDKAYVVSNRSYSDGDYYAAIVKLDKKLPANGYELYRGRICAIDEGRRFQVESFSRLKDLDWEYSDTPKTFNISSTTRILAAEGITNTRDFIGYGENSFIGDTVYVLTSATGTSLVSTASFGMQNISGKIYEVSDVELGEDGEVLKPPTDIKITNSKWYDNNTFKWNLAVTSEIHILKNSIIIKDNKSVSPSELKKGDQLRILCGSAAQEVNGYIIIVE